MKKGDIVKLKIDQSWTKEEAEDLGFKSASEIPEYFEVASTHTMVVCCTPIAVFRAVGIEDRYTFYCDAFEIALPAGEPDVAKLLEESKQTEIAWIGF